MHDLSAASDGRVSLSITDITQEGAVKARVGQVTDQLDQAGLDVLVSKAGILTPGPMEILPLQAIKREFEVNVFGGFAVINAFLPALRQSRGRIVAIGTMTGRFPLPFNGPSSSSKAALEAIADIYRSELKPFGVQFVLAQAGRRTRRAAAALRRPGLICRKTSMSIQGTSRDNFHPTARAQRADELARVYVDAVNAGGDAALDSVLARTVLSYSH